MTTDFAAEVNLNPVSHPTLSVDEFAVLFGISRGAAFRAVHNGEVPHCRLGKRIRIPTAWARRTLQLDDTGPPGDAA